MFITGEKLVRWYKQRGLIEEIDGDAKKLRLLFTPAGMGKHDHKYGLVELKNECVVCGTTEKLTKHHVVPHTYRKMMPTKLKSNNTHDIVVMCRDCHSEYENHATQLKKTLDPGITPEDQSAIIRARRLLKLKNHATKIVEAMTIENPSDKYWKTMSTLLHKLEDEHGGLLTWEQIEEYANSQVTIPNVDVGHPERVLRTWGEDLFSFCKMWRSHFLEFASPKFLPHGWSVDYNFD
jgi:hypothetical protein